MCHCLQVARALKSFAKFDTDALDDAVVSHASKRGLEACTLSQRPLAPVSPFPEPCKCDKSLLRERERERGRDGGVSKCHAKMSSRSQGGSSVTRRRTWQNAYLVPKCKCKGDAMTTGGKTPSEVRRCPSAELHTHPKHQRKKTRRRTRTPMGMALSVGPPPSPPPKQAQNRRRTGKIGKIKHSQNIRADRKAVTAPDLGRLGSVNKAWTGRPACHLLVHPSSATAAAATAAQQHQRTTDESLLHLIPNLLHSLAWDLSELEAFFMPSPFLEGGGGGIPQGP
ncbi:hypothetical protein LZ30DRAFT_741626 [Colletotrichum cereale]|nr:hypothetical protein LZ30DRAFT_741626 [Colletotrichum cereale]